MKKILGILLVVTTLLAASCGGSKHEEGKFAGKFTDEFENKFELNDDYTGTIQFAGNSKVEKITWSDGEDHKSPFATIMYNGDPTYYYLRDGKLYRHEEDMDHGEPAIDIKYE
jgi:hypothetical protein